jgi:diguanylate cyclase (GGDEF)-like protein
MPSKAQARKNLNLRNTIFAGALALIAYSAVESADHAHGYLSLAAISPFVAMRRKPKRKSLPRAASEVLSDFPNPAFRLNANGEIELEFGRLASASHSDSPEFATANLHPDDREGFRGALKKAVNGPLAFPVRVGQPDGTWDAFEARISFASDGYWVILHPAVPAEVSKSRDVGQYDALTGLANRGYFLIELDRALVSRERSNKNLAVLFVDIDHFKVINESLGHVAGDKLLDIFAQRLRASIRPTDFLARTSADEFVVLFPEIGSIEDAFTVSDRILKSLQSPVSIDGRTVVPSASLGLSLAEGKPTSDQLMRQADIAMFKAKQSGRNRLVLFSAEMSKQAEDRLELEQELRRAIEEDHFVLHYQPIVDLETSEIVQLEALIRWQHPEQGMISPMRFIPVAEQTGLILPIGEWVLREACRQTAEWQWEFGFNLGINVNLSALQLQSAEMVATVERALADSGLSPEYLKLEITESMMMENLEEHLTKLNQLRDMGVKIAVDDFGTGYSSMAYLSRLPLTTLKIDRSFVNRIGASKEDDAIVRSIVGLAKALNLSVTSEGIETESQLQRLQSLECEYGQGYFFSKPIPAQGIVDMLSQHGVRAA